VSAVVSPQPLLDDDEELLELDEVFEPLELAEAPTPNPPPDVVLVALEVPTPPEPPAPDAEVVPGADEDAPFSRM
jgi:hypothetical protein